LSELVFVAAQCLSAGAAFGRQDTLPVNDLDVSGVVMMVKDGARGICAASVEDLDNCQVLNAVCDSGHTKPS
jgi:hypothetical protein